MAGCGDPGTPTAARRRSAGLPALLACGGLLYAGDAFVGAACRGLGGAAAQSPSRLAQRALPMEAAAAVPEVLDVGMRGLAGLAALYVIMSANEYIYHRYFQHLGVRQLEPYKAMKKALNWNSYMGDGHVEHHKETLDDMSLTYKAKELDPCVYRGTVFPWSATVLMTLSVLVPSYPLLAILGWQAPLIFAAVASALLLHALVWNALHPHMHGLPDVPLSHGAPSGVLAGYRDSPVFNWLRQNHEGHHRADGAHGNYNVCCPLMDQVVGTSVGFLPPKPTPAPAAAP